MALMLSSPVTLTITADAVWRDSDVSAYLSSDASGALITIIPAANDAFAIRRNGSTDTWAENEDMEGGGRTMIIAPLDGNQIFEYWAENGKTFTMQLWGEVLEEEFFALTNATQYDFDTSWTMLDLTSDVDGTDVMKAAIFTMYTGGNQRDVGIRHADETTTLDHQNTRSGSQLVSAVNASDQVDVWSDDNNTDLYLTGYFKEADNTIVNASLNTDSYDIVTASTWETAYTGLGNNTVAFGTTTGASSASTGGIRAASGDNEFISDKGNRTFGALWYCQATSGSLQAISSTTNMNFHLVVKIEQAVPAGASFIGLPV